MDNPTRPAKTAPMSQPGGARPGQQVQASWSRLSAGGGVAMHGDADGSGPPKGKGTATRSTAAIPRGSRQASVATRGYSYAPGAELRP